MGARGASRAGVRGRSAGQTTRRAREELQSRSVLDGVQAAAGGFAAGARSLRSRAAWTPSPRGAGEGAPRERTQRKAQGSLMTLKIYPVTLELVRRLAPFLPKLRARSSSLGDQMERALISIPLNVAEGAYSRGKNRQARYQSAAASAREALACWETAQALGWTGPMDPDLAGLFQRIIGTLVRLTVPRA